MRLNTLPPEPTEDKYKPASTKKDKKAQSGKLDIRISLEKLNLLNGLTNRFSYHENRSQFVKTAIDLLLFYDNEISFDEIENEELKERIEYDEILLPKIVLKFKERCKFFDGKEES